MRGIFTMTSDSLLGKQFDEYRLEKLLGHGGMARVYRAVDTRLNRYTAIKVIDAPFRNDTEYAKRFEIEAQAIAQLDHPNIVTIYRYGEVDGLLYMAMQYIEGVNLEQLIFDLPKGEFLPLDEILKILRQLCDALDYAHQRGVIHRDIKPSNIMIDNNERVFLTDFGLALLTEVGTMGEIFGSPHYIAPEQAISSAGAVPQSDYYALGVTLYEMLTGRLPFDVENPMDLAMMHMSESPPPPRQFRPDLSPALEAIVLKLLAKEPAQRYPDGKSLVAAFEQAIQEKVGLPATRPSQSIANRVLLEIKKNPLPPIPAAVTPPPLQTRQAEKPTLVAAAPPPIISTPVSVQPALYTRQTTSGGHPFMPFLVGGGFILVVLVLVILGFFFLNKNNDKPNSSMAGTDVTETAAQTEVLETTPTEGATTSPAATDMPALIPTTPPTIAPTVVNARSYAITVKLNDNSVVITNITQNEILPLAPLSISNDIASIEGSAFGVDALEPQDCLVVAKDENRMKKLKLTCNPVSSLFFPDANNSFWRGEFSVYYDGDLMEICTDKTCVVQIRIQA
jgi:serine/threonine protein kinase